MVFMTEKEKVEFMEQITFYKKHLMANDRTLTEEKAVLMARQAISNLNLSFILADVCNSFLSDAEGTLKKMGMALSNEDKRRFTLMQKAVKSARVMASAFARPLYHMKDTDDACDCSDWYYHFLQLVETRITNIQKTRMLTEFLLTMPDEEKLYEVGVEDFCKN